MTNEPTPEAIEQQRLATEKKQRIDLLITLEHLPKPSPAVDAVLSMLFSEFHLALMQRHPDMDIHSMMALPFTDNANLTFMLAEFVLESKSAEPKGIWSLFQHGYLNGKWQRGLKSACITSTFSSQPGSEFAKTPTGLHWHGFGALPQTALLAALMRYLIWPNANDAEYTNFSKPTTQAIDENEEPNAK